ncbi:dimethylsulfoniopropionate lyase DddP [Tistlia consotensis]|uniref:Dimethylsulfoniopropionate lyase DddP n=1 Tax=Tistlia consotensis USBA 355 TaxID=560819 RepID=A0A1Y6BLK4_9PROT|nr:Xaa-Pro peptidase family protein [Tistlia consotensis]SMF09521.1 dimethylsulfoniopropionate lyase DddP [Tistlia consotensis USBA 355]SNR34456.1 dimethylsulfoniopropionate lyase DddP [Tistlia consotensis]
MPDTAVRPVLDHPDLPRMRRTRLAKVRDELRRRDIGAILLYDPVNIRYATDSRNMAVWTLHNAVRYAFVPLEGPVVVFDFHNCEHLSDGLETVDEVRPATGWYWFGAGPEQQRRVVRWAAEIAALIRLHGGGNRRLAVDRLDPLGTRALEAEGIEILDGQEPMEMARHVKTPDEILAMRHAVAACEAGMAAMHAALRPGMTENELWSILHQVNIARGGEWIETRLLASGPRTNPWFQECGERVIEAGDLVSFDSDLIGPYGMCADISRSFLCGNGRASEEQRTLYALALEQIESNIALLKPGMSYREFAERSFRLPEIYRPNRYSVIFHGVGLCDEYPACVYLEDFETGGYDGLVVPGMTICMESYAGAVGGREGVKLEQQLLVTESGLEPLSSFPFEETLLPSRWL